MSRLLVNLKSHFGVILVDSPPLGAGADAYALGIHTRNLLLVVRAGTTDRALATMKLKMADRLPLRVLGSVLNGVSAELGNYRYYSYLEGYEALSELEYTDAPAQLEPA
jgi:Mrp family chromosome partitioning ATPase